MGLGDSTISLISTLVGSGGLIVLITTSIISYSSQPNVNLDLIPNFLPIGINSDNPRISHYEIIAKNNGLGQAKNLTLSMFFATKIKNVTPVIFDQKIVYIKNGTLNNKIYLQNGTATNHKIGFASIYSQKLSPNAEMIVYVWPDNGHSGDSFYVSAAYDQGTNRVWSINDNDVKGAGFPSIYRVNMEPPIDSSIDGPLGKMIRT